MQSNIIVNISKPNTDNPRFQESASILMEMEMMGIDPAPFLEVAARDLIKQFGVTSLNYSAQIEQNFIDNGDIDSATIWSRISSQLSELLNVEKNIAH